MTWRKPPLWRRALRFVYRGLRIVMLALSAVGPRPPPPPPPEPARTEQRAPAASSSRRR